MSPTEDDLRRALSDGAGDIPDAGHIALRAHEQRARSRKRLLAAAATVVVVGGVAAGGTLLAQQNGDGPQTSSAASGATGDRTTENGAAASQSIPAARCAADAPHDVLPGGGGTNQFGSTEKLFAAPIRSVVVCAYPSQATSTRTADGVVLTGSDATTLTDSLENAATTRPRVACPMYRSASQATLTVTATTEDGRRLPVVTTTVNEPPCAVVVSNGTAVRYDWSLPTSLAGRFAELLSGLAAPTSSSVHGSPAH